MICYILTEADDNISAFLEQFMQYRDGLNVYKWVYKKYLNSFVPFTKAEYFIVMFIWMYEYVPNVTEAYHNSRNTLTNVCMYLYYMLPPTARGLDSPPGHVRKLLATWVRRWFCRVPSLLYNPRLASHDFYLNMSEKVSLSEITNSYYICTTYI